MYEGISSKVNRLGVSIHLSNEEPPPEMVEQLNDLFLLQQDGTGTLSPLTLDILVCISFLFLVSLFYLLFFFK